MVAHRLLQLRLEREEVGIDGGGVVAVLRQHRAPRTTSKASASMPSMMAPTTSATGCRAKPMLASARELDIIRVSVAPG